MTTKVVGDSQALVKLDQEIAGQSTIDRIAQAMREAAYPLDSDDQMLLASATEFQVIDADDYQRGYEVMGELGDLATRISAHYARFDKPLRVLTNVVRELKGPPLNDIDRIKGALSKRLGQWNADQERRRREEARKRQDEADAQARAEQDARAETLRKLAEHAESEKVAKSLQAEAAVIEALPVRAAPVEVAPVSVPVGGYTRTYWKCQVVDIKTLLRAYVDGHITLPESDLIAGVQGFLDKQAASLHAQLGHAYPGTEAVPIHTAIARRSSGK